MTWFLLYIYISIDSFFGDCSPAMDNNVNADRLPTRRSIKADREKMRRDKLNEQFLELASSLGKLFLLHGTFPLILWYSLMIAYLVFP